MDIHFSRLFREVTLNAFYIGFSVHLGVSTISASLEGKAVQYPDGDVESAPKA